MTDFKVGDKIRLTGSSWRIDYGREFQTKERVIEGFQYYLGVFPGPPGLLPVTSDDEGNRVYIWVDDEEDYSATLVEPAEDAVSPDHYKFGNSEVIDITRHLSFPLGNVVKYVTRAGRKGRAKEDLLKARKYLDWAIEDCDD